MDKLPWRLLSEVPGVKDIATLANPPSYELPELSGSVVEDQNVGKSLKRPSCSGFIFGS